MSERLIETAEKFTELVGLHGRVRFKQGSALAIPFDSERFDAVIIQHVAMQISEKEELFAELTQVVKPGPNTSPVNACARPRARGHRKSKTVAGR